MRSSRCVKIVACAEAMQAAENARASANRTPPLSTVERSHSCMLKQKIQREHSGPFVVYRNVYFTCRILVYSNIFRLLVVVHFEVLKI